MNRAVLKLKNNQNFIFSIYRYEGKSIKSEIGKIVVERDAVKFDLIKGEKVDFNGFVEIFAKELENLKTYKTLGFTF